MIIFQHEEALIIALVLISVTRSYSFTQNHFFKTECLHSVQHYTQNVVTEHIWKQSSMRFSSKDANYGYVGDATLSDFTFEDLYSKPQSTEINSLTFLDDNEENLLLPNWLTTRLQKLGYTHPTLIQQRALDTLLTNRKKEKPNVILQAQTGSGKTLSYLLPTLVQIDASRSAIQALIIVPTRELGLQVSRVAKRLAAASSSNTTAKGKIMVMSVLQGSQNKRQRAWAWAEPPHLVIGTPNEVLKMASKGGMRTNSLKVVVVDEVDACLDNKKSLSLHTLLSRYLSPTYEEISNTDGMETNSILSTTTSDINKSRKKHRQTIFASATIPQHHHFIQQCVQNQWITSTYDTDEIETSSSSIKNIISPPIHIQVTPGELIPPTLAHTFIVCSETSKKLAGLRQFLKRQLSKELVQSKSDAIKILIFCEEHRPIEQMAKVIARDLNGNVSLEKHSIYDQNPKEWNDSKHNLIHSHSSDVIVSVLRIEDSLSGRANAMNVFRGLDMEQFDSNLDSSKKSIRILLSTDLAARGLDVPDISHVINFDLPNDGDTYVHRGGRAGRMGRKGMVLSLITPGQEFVLERLVNKLGLKIKCIARQKQSHKKLNK